MLKVELKDLEVVNLSFPEIEKIWKMSLWKGRTTPVEEMSSMKFGGGFSNSISEPIYYGVLVRGQVLGVNSCHRVDDTLRSRGLFVFPEFRRQGVGSTLLKYAIGRAQQQNLLCWSFPRKEALNVYQLAGFEKASAEIWDPQESKINLYVSVAPLKK